jgi:hypothetical protein
VFTYCSPNKLADGQAYVKDYRRGQTVVNGSNPALEAFDDFCKDRGKEERRW